MSTIKNILLEETKLQDHLDSRDNNYYDYVANLLVLFDEYNIEFTILKLAKILAASFIRRDKYLAKFLLQNERYDLPVILKTCEILDSKRRFDQLNKKTDQIKDKKKLAKHKAILSNLQSLNEGIQMKLTSSKIKFLKENWIQKLPKERLEYMALLFSPKHWKFLIDLMHLKPSDFQLDWFTTYIFTGEYPQNSILGKCLNLTAENIKTIIQEYKLPYAYLRIKHKDLLTNEIKNILATYVDLGDIIRFWKEFNTEEITQAILNRLDHDDFNMPYGEMMKRIQMFYEDNTKDHNTTLLTNKLLTIAESKLNKYKIHIESPVVVLGDASPSMDVAIKTSSIIASILVKLCHAKLHLFRSDDEPILNPPTNVNEVLETLKLFKFGGSTAPAASLYPYYERKEIVKTFILVTDEEENRDYTGHYGDKSGYFANIFKKYTEEVYPAKLVFISFLRNNQDGQMVRELKQLMPNINIMQFFLNNQKPDLRKLDTLMHKLTMETNLYDDQCQIVKTYLEKYNTDLIEVNVNDILNNDIKDDIMTIII
ncbi:hypothetical protein Klosneuvirus_2_223 [Klosneuvirus KNV1]|uniref:Uncharacterized protein n=1 Tax=Klosneuvirus KNV1 TaxID=1977640 RepID=A0A1V0SJ81_9VIRU|nr:hypothetical protein Klosneuvirus_2_223 [Klosneuvirus KNV1]